MPACGCLQRLSNVRVLCVRRWARVGDLWGTCGVIVSYSGPDSCAGLEINVSASPCHCFVGA